ncbi:zinc-binding dehydrogenase [Streptosporangium sp. CA-135522]|uniref:zinc-binding dehydrogenase n=1 Tax=Streptosporangium sp. CA-135522 TaxID=3240072 RepID=UPI003D8D13CD
MAAAEHDRQTRALAAGDAFLTNTSGGGTHRRGRAARRRPRAVPRVRRRRLRADRLPISAGRVRGEVPVGRAVAGVSPEPQAAARERGVRTSAFLVEPDGTVLSRIAALVDAGDVTVEPKETFSLEQAAHARTRGEGVRTRDKLVLRIAP